MDAISRVVFMVVNGLLVADKDSFILYHTPCRSLVPFRMINWEALAFAPQGACQARRRPAAGRVYSTPPPFPRFNPATNINPQSTTLEANTYLYDITS